jgi:hypothetical protein
MHLLLAFRWPAALILSSVVLAAALLKILSQPIPIRIDGGGINVERLVMPQTVTIKAEDPIPVLAGVTVDGNSTQKGEQPIRITGPVVVKGIESPVKVSGSVGANIDGRVTANVDAIDSAIQLQSPVQVVNDQPLQVEGAVTVAEPVSVDGNVEVKGRVGIEGKVGTRIGF